MESRSSVRPEIQALRAAAVLSVVIYHLWPNRLPGGFVGVDVFFAISGFLITGHLLRELQRTGTIAVGAFWARRIRRLLPASLLVLLVTAAAVIVFVPRALWSQFSRAIVAAVGYGENWLLAHDAVDYLAAENVATPVQHFWSLGVEEQFYVVWPLILLGSTFFVLRRGRRLDETSKRRRVVTPVVVALGIVFVGSLTLSVVVTQTDPSIAYFGTHIRAWEFAAGGLVAALVPEAISVRPRLANVLSWLGWAGIAVTLISFTGATPFPSATALLPVASALLVIVAGSPQGQWSSGPLMEFGPVRWLGDISYSLYLWHWPLIVLVPYALAHPLGFRSKVAILVLSLVLAAASKGLVEDPVRRFRPIAKGRSVWTYGSAIVAMVLVAALPFGAIQYTVDVQQKNIAAADQLVKNGGSCFGANAMVGSGCKAATGKMLLPDPAGVYDDTGGAFDCYRPAGQATLKKCSFGSNSDTATRVAVVGDSHAAMLIPGLRDRVGALGWHVDTYVGNGGVWRAPDSAPVGADRTYLNALNTALDDGRYDIVLTTARRAPETSTSSDTVQKAMESVWKQADRRGIKVVALQDNPRITPTVHDCAVADSTATAASARCTVPRSYGLGGTDNTAIAAKAAGVPLVDLTKYYCRSSSCSAVIGGVIVYRDVDHITATYSRSIAPYLLKDVAAKAEAIAAGS